MELGKLFIVIGVALVIIGAIYTLVPNLSFPPKLPGDIFIKRGNVTFYFPIVTSIVLSIVVTIIMHFLMRK